MQKTILTVLKNKGCTGIISEHRLHYLRDLVDKTFVLGNGKILHTIQRDEFLCLANDDMERLGLRCMFLNDIGFCQWTNRYVPAVCTAKRRKDARTGVARTAKRAG